MEQQDILKDLSEEQIKYIQKRLDEVEQMKQELSRKNKNPELSKQLRKIRNQKYYYKHQAQILEKAKLKRLNKNNLEVKDNTEIQ